MALKFLLVSLVAAASAMETPLWFIKSGLSGSFSERSDQCKEILAEGGDEARVASLYPIVIPSGEEADICIRFPKTEELAGGWRHDRGEVGQCTDSCCLFLPPVSNIAELRNKVQPTWFETTSDCSDTSAAKTAPILFKGEGDAPMKICVQGEDGGFALRDGKISTCSLGCCFFYERPN